MDVDPNEHIVLKGGRLLFWIGLFYYVTWWVFYGVAWAWALMRFLGQRQSVMEIARVWTGFQAKMDVQDSLTKLTACLQDGLPNRNATIADFVPCLKGMGVNDG
jgi:hypothetical protein